MSCLPSHQQLRRQSSGPGFLSSRGTALPSLLKEQKYVSPAFLKSWIKQPEQSLPSKPGLLGKVRLFPAHTNPPVPLCWAGHLLAGTYRLMELVGLWPQAVTLSFPPSQGANQPHMKHPVFRGWHRHTDTVSLNNSYTKYTGQSAPEGSSLSGGTANRKLSERREKGGGKNGLLRGHQLRGRSGGWR